MRGIEVTPGYARPYRLPLFNLRWSAVLAGLVVGLTCELFLLLAGAAMGFALINAGARISEPELLVAASSWNAFSMVAASITGGYVAARASGMRRTADGVLHGLLAWGVAMLTLLLLATSTAGAVLTEIVDAAGRPAQAGLVRPLDDEEREAVLDVLVDRLGVSGPQAAAIAAQIHVPLGHGSGADEELRADARQALRAASMLSGWLSTAVLLSLVGAIGGGILGCRSTRRTARGEERREAAVQAANEPRGPDEAR